MAGTFGLYWWRPGGGKINLGDEISPVVLGHVTGRKIRHAQPLQCDGIAIGSIFNKRTAKIANRTHPLFVWGSGTLQPKPCRLSQLSVILSALRGPHTAAEIVGCPDLPFGDPGLFASEIWPAGNDPSGRVALIPHHSMIGLQTVTQLADALGGAEVLDFTHLDISATLRALSQARLVVSSSLHGLIIADSYGIPSLFWNEGGDRNEWKFRDYFDGAGRSDFIGLTAEQILSIVTSGRMEDLPFSCLSATALADRLADLREAAKAMPEGAK